MGAANAAPRVITSPDAGATTSNAEYIKLVAGTHRQLSVTTLVTRRASPVVQEASVSTFNLALQCGTTAPCPNSGSGVRGWVQLDEHTPRPFSVGRPLNSLLNEDEETAPGAHTLLAALLTLERIHADAVSFRIEPTRRNQGNARPSFHTTQPESAQPPLEAAAVVPAVCFLLLPESTVNGAGAARLELQAVLLDVHGIEQPAPVQSMQGGNDVLIHYTARGEAGAARGSFLQGTSAILEQPPRGDLHIHVSCERAGKVVAESDRTVTLNPELTGVEK